MFTGISPLTLDGVRSWRLRYLAEYWLAKRAGRDLPERDDIQLPDLKNILPHLLLAQIQPDPFRVFYRVTGTKIVEMCGDLTGRHLDELGNSASPWIREGQESYYRAWSGRTYFLGEYVWPTLQGAACNVEFGIFPVLVPGKPMQCFALEDYDFGETGLSAIDSLAPFGQQR